ncbi:MAG: hypothetical protein WA231_06700 [Methylocella sp.]
MAEAGENATPASMAAVASVIRRTTCGYVVAANASILDCRIRVALAVSPVMANWLQRRDRSNECPHDDCRSYSGVWRRQYFAGHNAGK